MAGLLDLLRFLSVLSLDLRLLGGLPDLLLRDLGGLGSLALLDGEALHIASLGHVETQRKKSDINKTCPQHGSNLAMHISRFGQGH